ncbi:MAG: UMP kinase, partial [Thermoproteota archaeon]|nr:UMP kinase [Thermoproteota archaeon]
VIKLSGSIFSQDANHSLIKKYAEMLSDISIRVQPIVIAGGGIVARHYINLARNLGSDEANLDIIGIEVSRINAKLLITALGDRAYSQVPKNLEEVAIAVASNKIVIAGGLHPGQSTNATSALIAEASKASSFVNATDVDGIYDSDPNTNSNARLFKEITVNECVEILKVESAMAGTYDLMDIIALKVIERSKIPTRVVRSNISNIRDAVDGKDIGTKIIAFRKQS